MPGMALPQVHPAAGQPEFSHHALGGVVLVGIQGCLVSTGELSCHRFGSIPISVAHRWLALAIDDRTVEQQATAIGFLSRAVAWFNGKGVECRQVMSDNGPAYLSRSFAKASAMVFQNSQERDHWLPRYHSIYNQLRKHSALGGRSPQQRLNELLC